jgi:hypothetical protein
MQGNMYETRKTRQEANAVIQVRDNNDLKHSDTIKEEEVSFLINTGGRTQVFGLDNQKNEETAERY